MRGYPPLPLLTIYLPLHPTGPQEPCSRTKMQILMGHPEPMFLQDQGPKSETAPETSKTHGPHPNPTLGAHEGRPELTEWFSQKPPLNFCKGSRTIRCNFTFTFHSHTGQPRAVRPQQLGVT